MNKSDSEIWKTHPEFDFIQGSTWGRVRTLDRVVSNGKGMYILKGRILKQSDNGTGYLYVSFRVNGKHVHRYVHRLVIQTFIPNPKHFPEVNHIDCDPTNNCIDNLEWVSHQENVAYRDKLGHTAKHNSPNKPVIAVNLKTLEVSRFESQREAGYELEIAQSNINSVLKGKRKQTGGFWFTYSDNNTVENVGVKFGDKVACKVE